MNNNCILVVDDELRMRKLIKDFLIASGFNILEAEDGEQALEVFEKEKNRINLILLDVPFTNSFRFLGIFIFP